jgi:hypothetical protein
MTLHLVSRATSRIRPRGECSVDVSGTARALRAGGSGVSSSATSSGSSSTSARGSHFCSMRYARMDHTGATLRTMNETAALTAVATEVLAAEGQSVSLGELELALSRRTCVPCP